MKKALLPLSTFLMILFCVAGCATTNPQHTDTIKKIDAVADKYFPQVPEQNLGKSVPGEMVGYAYDFKKQTGSNSKYLLMNIPLCLEEREKLTSFTNRPSNAAGIAATMSLPLIIFTGPSMAPIISAGIDRGWSKSRQKTVEKQGFLKTGRVLLCGDKKPAPGETLIIQSPGDSPLTYLQTDTNGQFDLHDIIFKTGDSPYLNIFIKQDNSSYYLSTIFTH